MRGFVGVMVMVFAAPLVSGCAAVGLASGPLVSAVQAFGDRTVERSVRADLHAASRAVQYTLIDAAMRVEHREADDEKIVVRAAADNVTVHALPGDRQHVVEVSGVPTPRVEDSLNGRIDASMAPVSAPVLRTVEPLTPTRGLVSDATGH